MVLMLPERRGAENVVYEKVGHIERCATLDIFDIVRGDSYPLVT